MPEPARASHVVRFGTFEVDLRSGELHKGGLRIKIQEQPSQVLAMLLEHPGEMVTREELRKKLWPEDTFVDFEHGLNAAINKLREALGDSADNPRFVETLPRRGYRFIAPVVGADGVRPDVGGGFPSTSLRDGEQSRTVVPAPIQSGPASEGRPQGAPLRKRWAAIALAGAVVLGGAVSAYWLTRPLPTPRVTGSAQLTHDGYPKYMGVTDGARLFFNEYVGDHYVLAQTSVGGGEPVPISTPFENTDVLDISPNRTELLLGRHGAKETDNPLWTLPTLGGSPRRLGEMLCHDAAWAPDGKTILCARGQDLYVSGSDASQSRKLVSLPGMAYSSRWSPDGKRARFTLFDSKEKSISLWEVDADGSHLHPLLPGWNSPPEECCGNWTSDGRYYLFSSARGGTSNIWAVRETHGLFRKGSLAPVQLTTGTMDLESPLVSLDGKRLFVIGHQERGELVRYDAKAAQWVPYLAGISAQGVSFSRDGKRLAYVTYPEGSLWRSESDGSEQVQLTFPPLQTSQPYWSPDGKRIAFMGLAPDHHWHIFLVGMDGGNPQQLTSGDRDQADPSWSPDGSSLAYGELPDPLWQGALIRVLDLNARRDSMVPGSEGIFGPRWSPNGRYLVANSARASKPMLFDFSTQKWEVLGQLNSNYFTWSRDSDAIYFDTTVEKDPAFYCLRIRNRMLQRVLSLKNIRRVTWYFTAWSGLTPDNSPLVLRDTGTQEIYALDWEAP